MSAPNNPQLSSVSAALPTTPAQEWADSTTSALQSQVPADSPKEATHSTKSGTLPSTQGSGASRNTAVPPLVSTSSGSTPGNEFPGAFPRDRGEPPVEGIAGAVVDTAYGIYESAKQYVPAQTDVQNAIENASATAKQYLPESVGSYLPGGTRTVSLPSSEIYGNLGKSSDGAGALPGNLSEVSVAKLPEERRLEALERAKEFSATDASEQPPSTHTPAQSTGGVGGLPGSKSPLSKEIGDDDYQPSSTTDPTNTMSTPAGADLDASRIPLPPTPARPRQASVLTPAIPAVGGDTSGGLSSKMDNLNLAAAANGSHDSAMYDAAKAAGVEPPLDEGSVGRNGDLLTPVAAGKAQGDTKGDEKQHIMKEWEDMNTAVMKDTDMDKSAKLPQSDVRQHEQQLSEHEREKRASLSPSGSGNGRPSFMDKIKGEAKIISGKLAKNEEKVEEGKRMMGKV